MKSFIITVLASSLLLNGCTSFKPLRPEERAQGRPKPDERMRVILHDGSVIEPSHRVEVSVPSDFVYGAGKLFLTARGEQIPFTGKILRSRIDSVLPVYTGTGKGSYLKKSLVCWLSDGNRVKFEGGRYFDVTPDSGAGVWYIGVLESKGEKLDFAGRILDQEIKGIEVRKIDAVKTAIAVLVPLGVVVVLITFVEPPVDLDMGGFSLGRF